MRSPNHVLSRHCGRACFTSQGVRRARATASARALDRATYAHCAKILLMVIEMTICNIVNINTISIKIIKLQTKISYQDWDDFARAQSYLHV